jgi:heme a synthase
LGGLLIFGGSLKYFKRSVLTAVLSTYFLIFIGGLVRVSGAGLGCPDWPKCFGRWIPPISLRQLPAEMDPNLFNFTLAWIEYVNRLIGVFVGFAILATAILAIKYFRSNKKILVPSILAVFLVAFQGWQGGQVVASELEPLLVSSHLLVALLIVSTLLYVLQQINFMDRFTIRNRDYSTKTKLAFLLLWIFLIVQIVIGTQVRGSIEMSLALYPLSNAAEILNEIKSIDLLHRTTGSVVIVCSLFASFFILRKETNSQLKNYSIILLITVGFQFVIGISLVYFGLAALAQLFHLWTASILVGLLLLINTSLSYTGVRNE